MKEGSGTRGARAPKLIDASLGEMEESENEVEDDDDNDEDDTRRSVRRREGAMSALSGADNVRYLEYDAPSSEEEMDDDEQWLPSGGSAKPKPKPANKQASNKRLRIG